MANTTKTTKAATKKEEMPVEAKVDTSAVAQENEQLRSEMADMKAKMELLIQQMSGMYQNSAPARSADEDRDIEVISLTSGALLITTTGRSDGTRYLFPKQFETRFIPESDLKKIIHAMLETTREGYFYINDEQFVKENGLVSVYREILDKTAMASILTKPVEEFMAEYNRVPDAQKDIIEHMVRDKKLRGEYVDANILMALGKACDKDFMNIEPVTAE